MGPAGTCAACLLGLALSPPVEPDLTGMQLGPFAIQRKLGEGGMGVVYEAVDTRPTSLWFGHTVALKILAAEIDDPEQIVREAQLLAKLDHANIVRVYDAGEHEGIPYFTMKRIDGGPLRTPAESPRRAAEIALSVARAVEHAHRYGILHRDLKPANVLVDREARVFVTDFGVAAREGLVTGYAGTPGYMAPEVLRGYMAPEVLRGEPGVATTMADVWGAGAILYELLAGRPPFEASSLEELEGRVTNEPPPALEGVPADLAAVCLHCLEKEPSRRYASCGELAADLARFLAGDDVTPNPLGPVNRALRRAKRHPLITAIVTLLFLATLYASAATLYAAATRASRDRAQQAALNAADFAARRAADLAALQFDRYKAVVEAAGRDPRVARAAADPASTDAANICARLLAEHGAPAGDPFSVWLLFDVEGRLICRAPKGVHATAGRSYTFRDYYRGVKALADEGRRAAYVSRAFSSEGDDVYVIAIAYPVHDDADRWVGIVGGVLTTGSALGSIVLDDEGREDLTASLLAPRDRERSPGVIDPAPVFILHRALRRGEALPAHADEPPDTDLEAGALMRVVPVRGTPFSVVVRVAVGSPPARER